MMPAAAANAKAKAAAAVPKGKAQPKGKAAAAKAKAKQKVAAKAKPKAAPKAAPRAAPKAVAKAMPAAPPRPPMPHENPLPRVLHPLLEYEGVQLVTTAFPLDDVARVVVFMLGCHCDTWRFLLHQMMMFRPGLLRQLTEYYTEARATEGRRVRARIAYNLPLAVMPNGIVRSRPL